MAYVRVLYRAFAAASCGQSKCFQFGKASAFPNWHPNDDDLASTGMTKMAKQIACTEVNFPENFEQKTIGIIIPAIRNLDLSPIFLMKFMTIILKDYRKTAL